MTFDPVTLGLTAGINAIATNLAKVSIEGGWRQFLQLSQHSRNELVLNFSAPALEYAENYINRHGIVKSLGMRRPVLLDELFTTVLVLEEDAVKRFSLEQQEQHFKERNLYMGNDEKRPGLEIANKCQYLMVLGGPGIGKTTFLRKVGLEALKGKQGNYLHELIPVLLELRTFREGTIDLKQAISQEFANCGLSDYEKFTDKFLGDGKLLILLDGLDEVPTNRTAEMVQKIQDFVSQYSKNHFIASCRIAAYRHNFQRFTDITIVDFDDKQIHNFIDNWFRSHGRSELGTRCWEKLNSTEHCATKELAHTPLLLTLICIVYNTTVNFPASKATLYERALQVLLEEWDATKEIIREFLYKDLNTKRKTIMLEEVAYTSFIANRLFIQRHEITTIIETVLKRMLPNEKEIDGKKVIKDIEKQHGLLVARDEGIYSFSHLTIQEYLTAQHILENDEISLDSVVNDYLLDRNWREVFILIAGIRTADRLLQAMENRIHDYMKTEKLQNLLVWVANVANPLGGNIQSLGKRALAITNANAIANAYIYAKSVADNMSITNLSHIIFNHQTVQNDIARNNSKSMKNSKIFENYITRTNAMAIDVAIAYSYPKVISDAYSIVYAKSIAVSFFKSINSAINNLIEYAETVEREKVYQSIDLSELIEEMNNLKNNIPHDGQSIIHYQQFAKRLFQSWFHAFRLKSEMLDFNLSDLQAMENYLYAIKLIIDCRKGAVQVRNSSAWEQIESRLLMPKSLHQSQ